MHLYMHSGGAKSSQSSTSEARTYQVVSILAPVVILLFFSVHLHCMIAYFVRTTIILIYIELKCVSVIVVSCFDARIFS